MLILTVLSIATVLSVIWCVSEPSDEIALVSAGVSVLLLGICLIALPFNHYSGNAEIQRYYALKESYESSRSEKISEFERATIAQKIAEYNADIASVKYWNGTIFDIFIPDELAELDPLK